MVTGNLPPLESNFNFYKNVCILLYCSGYFYFLYSWSLVKSYSIFESIPYRVFISGFLILGNSRSSSSIHSFACYEIIISRFRSYLLRALNKIYTP